MTTMTPEAPSAEPKQAETENCVPVDISNAPKTRGELFYDVLQFSVGKVAIIAATAVIAFVAHPTYGPDKLGPMPNYLKKFQRWFHKKLLHNEIYPLKDKGESLGKLQTSFHAKILGNKNYHVEKGEIGQRIAGAAANTMMTFHGGNVFAPIMKWMENSRMEIAGWANRKWGKPGDEAISNERLKDTPQQNWGDVVKGRLAAWAIVFSGFMGADLLIGKGKLFGRGVTNKYRFDQYEDGFARWLAGFTKGGKEIGKIPISKELTKIQKNNFIYRFGKIIALDLYATSIAIGLWTMVSRSSARKRCEKNGNGKSETLPETKPEALPAPPAAAEPEPEKKYSEGLEPRGPLAAGRETPPEPSHSGALAAQRVDGGPATPGIA